MRCLIVLDAEILTRESEGSGRVWTRRRCPLCGDALLLVVDHAAPEQDVACERCFGVVGRAVIAHPEIEEGEGA